MSRKGVQSAVCVSAAIYLSRQLLARACSSFAYMTFMHSYTYTLLYATMLGDALKELQASGLPLQGDVLLTFPEDSGPPSPFLSLLS